MSAVATSTEKLQYKVRAYDLLAAGKREEALELADLGRKEITLAEDEMPGLMALRARYASQQPLKGVKIT